MQKITIKSRYDKNQIAIPDAGTIEIESVYGNNIVTIPTVSGKTLKTEFTAKYGENVVYLPTSGGNGSWYYDGARGLSNLYRFTFTIINQIPQSASIATKVAWKKHYLTLCRKDDGIYDRDTQQMQYSQGEWTAYCKEWQTYKKPTWTDGGYYTLADDEKDGYYTANVGDLLIFDKIDDVAPTTTAEFQALATKYKNNGGLITAAQGYINYKSNGEAWSTNHIEMIRS